MRKITFVLVLVWIFTGCQDETATPPGEILTAHIAGVVTITGHPIAGAVVRVSSGANTTTDTSGHYCLSVPMFSEVTLDAFYRPPGQVVRAGDWLARTTVQTSDFSSCEHAQREDIALRFEPL